ncbi:MAG TPA: hypothetical protein VFY79_04745 [Dehalococcoidia bacterium]|nr:hypothetical protein [Dehalococcoidia bacterium]
MTPPRRIGRILSLGFPLPGPLVDNYNFLTAPAFFDYDAIVADVGALSELIEGASAGSVEAQTFGGKRVLNQPERADDVPLADVLLRRIDETKRLLAHDGLVLLFAAPPVAHNGVAGVAPLDDYYWLRDACPALLGSMRPGDGTRIDVTDYEHPLAAFLDGERANVAYRAYFDAGEGVRVFATSAGGQAVAVEPAIERGRVVALPALTLAAGASRYALSGALQAGIRRALGVMAEGRPPGWVEGLPLPGLEDRRNALDAAKRARDEAQRTLDSAETHCDQLARYQRLLWQEGALGLDDVVLDALRLIGFEVFSQQDAGIELRTDAGSVLVEVDASEGAIDMAAHHRLRQRIERAIEQRGSAPRGLLLVNGYRLQPPAARPQQVTDAVRTASETMGYCIATTASLFDAVVAHLGAESTDDYRARLLRMDGLLPQ